MNVISLEVDFADFAFVTLHCQNVCLVFNFAETVHTRNSQNKPHTKFKAFTVICLLILQRYFMCRPNHLFKGTKANTMARLFRKNKKKIT